MSVSIGTRLGPYEILAFIGAGGMGEVYRAKDSRLGRDVAIKVFAGERTNTQSRILLMVRPHWLSGVSYPNQAVNDNRKRP